MGFDAKLQYTCPWESCRRPPAVAGEYGRHMLTLGERGIMEWQASPLSRHLLAERLMDKPHGASPRMPAGRHRIQGRVVALRKRRSKL